MTKRKKYLHEKQYDGFARSFMEADEQFPDVTRKDLYQLTKGMFARTAIQWRLGYDNPQPPKLLDLGCGYGKDLAHFSKGDIDIYGVDSSQQMLKLAKKRVPSAHLEKGSFHNLPFSDNYFDMVFSRYAIQHVEDTDKVFREVQES